MYMIRLIHANLDGFQPQIALQLCQFFAGWARADVVEAGSVEVRQAESAARTAKNIASGHITVDDARSMQLSESVVEVKSARKCD